MRFSFRSIGITVHYGEIGATNKPQMFRAEWAGRANWFGSGAVFQAEGAGHPHWQFDALDSIKFEQDNDEVFSLLESIRSFSDEESPQEFSFDSTTAARTSVREIGNDISKIHFASAAAFWKTGESHAHQPNDISDLSVWLDKTLDYISKECRR